MARLSKPIMDMPTDLVGCRRAYVSISVDMRRIDHSIAMHDAKAARGGVNNGEWRTRALAAREIKSAQLDELRVRIASLLVAAEPDRATRFVIAAAALLPRDQFTQIATAADFDFLPADVEALPATQEA